MGFALDCTPGASGATRHNALRDVLGPEEVRRPAPERADRTSTPSGPSTRLHLGGDHAAVGQSAQS